MQEEQLSNDAKVCIRWALGLTLVFIIIFPGIMFATGYDYSLSFFKGWTYVSFGWLIVAGLFIAIRPIVEFYNQKE
ncbi:hypothetical protein Q9251_01430 [Alkalihalobacillus macyae]|uniref:hypothetical protein n=1 Tax=Guptibacillus hwajinpoensis TaxID=208199 RepID=UPI00273C1EAC|nr:hypothetical protein [Alkalihalobacillus macyae]MDP4549538.1 hypothetical protein [Alkalihalobacillus macyae]